MLTPYSLDIYTYIRVRDDRKGKLKLIRKYIWLSNGMKRRKKRTRNLYDNRAPQPLTRLLPHDQGHLLYNFYASTRRRSSHRILSRHFLFLGFLLLFEPWDEMRGRSVLLKECITRIPKLLGDSLTKSVYYFSQALVWAS